MSPEQQQLAIEEWCGWTTKTRQNCYEGKYTVWLKDGKPSSVPTPDYLNDLNAMHEAEKKIDREFYVAQLLAVIHEVDSDYFSKISWENGYELTTATAAQRAEALLRTIGKWID